MHMESLRQVLSELLEWRVLLLCGIVMVNPLFWNTISRLEYHTRIVSRVCGGPKRGITALAAGILCLNYIRTTTFHKAIDHYSSWDLIENESFIAVGWLLIIVGAVLVIASSYKLGFFCSFMGDYFGILLNERISGFPFNVVDDPMYWGSALIYLGIALKHASLVGVVMTACVALSYAVGVCFEEPFTAKIYEQKAKRDAEKMQ